MKKYTAYKTVQLILFVFATMLILLKVFPDTEIYHQVAVDPTMKILCTILWAILALSFFFIFLDYTYFFGYRKEYREMEYAARSDPVSGIANRFSCDMVIEKYLDKPLPEDMGCIMFDLTNIQEINKLYGHVQGNVAIRDFSNILRLSSDGLCFVGRNGGNKFLALFEYTTKESMQIFLDRVSQRVFVYNRDAKEGPLEFNFGMAFHEGSDVKEITNLISLANSRISRNK